MSSITIATTEKNKPLLIYNGFNYTIDRTLDTKIYWKCEYCRTNKCKGRIHTNVNFTNILHETGCSQIILAIKNFIANGTTGIQTLRGDIHPQAGNLIFWYEYCTAITHEFIRYVLPLQILYDLRAISKIKTAKQ